MTGSGKPSQVFFFCSQITVQRNARRCLWGSYCGSQSSGHSTHMCSNVPGTAEGLGTEKWVKAPAILDLYFPAALVNNSIQRYSEFLLAFPSYIWGWGRKHSRLCMSGLWGPGTAPTCLTHTQHVPGTLSSETLVGRDSQQGRVWWNQTTSQLGYDQGYLLFDFCL